MLDHLLDPDEHEDEFSLCAWCRDEFMTYHGYTQSVKGVYLDEDIEGQAPFCSEHCKRKFLQEGCLEDLDFLVEKELP